MTASMELRNLFGLRDDGKRIYVINSDHVSEEEYQFCQVLTNVLWGHKGLVESLGPAWHMIHDPRFEEIERQFVSDRPAVFGGDARLGKQYVDENSIMGHSVSELEAYAEILGEGRHFYEMLSTLEDPVQENENPREFKNASDPILWKWIRSECPNYFDNKDNLPNKRAQRLYLLLKHDLVGLIADYAEVAMIREWIKLDTGELALQEDFHSDRLEDNPVVWAEVDALERALTIRASLRVTAVKILEKCGLLKMMESLDIQLTDSEMDTILKQIYQLPYDELDKAPIRALDYMRAYSSVPLEERQKRANLFYKKTSQELVSKLKDGTLEPVSLTKEEEISIELTKEEQLALALHKEPLRRELFVMYVEAEEASDANTIRQIEPVLYDLSVPITEEQLGLLKTSTRVDRTSTTVKNILGM